MTAVLWTVLGFSLGALPLSLWLGRITTGKDIRQFGDGNPGGTNVGRASGKKSLGALAIFLDMLKGALPVALAHYVYDVTGWSLTPVIVAPILGHAFSPFLGFRGGKALAATFGAWTALTVPFGPFVMTLSLLAFHKLQTVPGWAVVGALLALLAFLALRGTDLPLYAAWLGTVAILLYKHRSDLGRAPKLRIHRGRRLSQ
jgi:acyl phosphate:glycerol-3-phosphate acyltransferase